LDSITAFSKTNRNSAAKMRRNATYQKLIIQTYLLGGNLVYVSKNDSSIVDKEKFTLDGIVYTDQLPNIDDFKEIVKSQPNQNISKITKYLPKYLEQRVLHTNKSINLGDYQIDGDIIYVTFKEKRNPYNLKIIYLGKDKIVLMKKEGDRIINYLVLL
jgi:hypothetical protein